MTKAIDVEVDRNFDFFQTIVGELLPAYAGKHALIRHQKIDGFFDRAIEAMAEGMRRYPDQMFSVQEVTEEPIDLGFFSHAIDLGLRY